MCFRFQEICLIRLVPSVVQMLVKIHQRMDVTQPPFLLQHLQSPLRYQQACQPQYLLRYQQACQPQYLLQYLPRLLQSLLQYLLQSLRVTLM